MALIKEIRIENVAVAGKFKILEVATDTVIVEDGKDISRSRHRHTIHPDVSAEDLALEHADVQTVANSGIWTQEVKDAWVAQKELDASLALK